MGTNYSCHWKIRIRVIRDSPELRCGDAFGRLPFFPKWQLFRNLIFFSKHSRIVISKHCGGIWKRWDAFPCSETSCHEGRSDFSSDKYTINAFGSDNRNTSFFRQVWSYQGFRWNLANPRTQMIVCHSFELKDPNPCHLRFVSIRWSFKHVRCSSISNLYRVYMSCSFPSSHPNGAVDVAHMNPKLLSTCGHSMFAGQPWSPRRPEELLVFHVLARGMWLMRNVGEECCT